MYPTAWNAVFQAFWEYLPEHALKLLRHIPTREYVRVKHTGNTFKKYARRLVAQKSAELASDKRNKDVMSVLSEPHPPCANKCTAVLTCGQ